MWTEETQTHSAARVRAGDKGPSAECGAATAETDRGGESLVMMMMIMIIMMMIMIKMMIITGHVRAGS